MIAGAFSSTSNLADKVLTTNGDILYYNSGRQRLAKEDNDDVLTLKSGLPSWEPVSGGATVTQSSINYNNQTTTEQTFTAYTGGTDVDLTSSGSCIIVHSVLQENDTAGQWTATNISVDGSAVGRAGLGATDTAQYQRQICISYSMANGGEAINGGWYVSGGTGTLTGGEGTNVGSRTTVFEVS